MTKIVLSLLFMMLMSTTRDADPSPKVIESFSQDQVPSVLVFSKTAGFRHNSIEAGIEAVKQLGSEHGFSVNATEDSDYFTPENLEKYSVVIFMNTTGTLFDDLQRAAFKQYIQGGGGFVGVHSATDTEYDWPWYGGLVGAYFANHPNNPNVREAELFLTNTTHLSTIHLPERWVREDEWYNFGTISDAIQVVVKLDTDSYEGSDHPGNHPASWYQEYDGGRAFYTAMGHTTETFYEPDFLRHLLGGIRYAMGEE